MISAALFDLNSIMAAFGLAEIVSVSYGVFLDANGLYPLPGNHHADRSRNI